MYRTEVMSSYNDVTVNIIENLSPWKYDILYTPGKKIWRWWIFNQRLGVENVRNRGYDVMQWRHS